MNDRYRGVKGGRMVLFMNQLDIAELNLAAGSQVTLYNSAYPEMELADLTLVSYAIPRRCLASYFPEANVLIPFDSLGARSQTPTSKSIVVRLHPNS
jgi:formate dehydrogenase major subunit